MFTARGPKESFFTSRAQLWSLMGRLVINVNLTGSKQHHLGDRPPELHLWGYLDCDKNPLAVWGPRLCKWREGLSSRARGTIVVVCCRWWCEAVSCLSSRSIHFLTWWTTFLNCELKQTVSLKWLLSDVLPYRQKQPLRYLI